MLDNINYRYALTNQIEQLKQATISKLCLSVNGGMFDITPELIAFVSVLAKNSNSAILLDRNSLPVQIDNVEAFLDEAMRRYINITSAYYAEYNNIKKKRNISALNE